MNSAEHCTFCDHKQFDFTQGNFCGLTGKKPDFIRKCPKIKLEENAKEEIARINLEYVSIQKQKVDTFGHLVLFSILGVVIIIASIYFTKYLYDLGWISTYSILGIAAGFSAFIYALAPFYKYREANGAAKSQKKRLDNFLALYDYDYEIDFSKKSPQEGVKLFRSKRSM